MKSYSLIFIALLLLISCVKDTGIYEYGVDKVYMPQASLLNGGISNDYPVPIKLGNGIENYTFDTTTKELKILLGVYKSGKETAQAFDVEVYADEDSTSSAVSANGQRLALPSDVYTLPTSASVAQGTRETSFYLTVDVAKLIEKYPDYSIKKLTLVVGIKNPTAYELNESLSKTVVLIDASAFMPAPSIVKGGDMSAGSEQYWTILNIMDNNPVEPGTVTFANGKLILSNGSGSVNRNTAIYQPITLMQGQRYKLSSDFTSTGGAVNSEIFMLISQTEPKEGQYYSKTGVFMHADSWAGKLVNPFAGNFADEANWKEGFDNSGAFTSTFTGEGYLIIVFASWGGNIGTITLDNIKIEAL